ncbi:MAG: FMN reductase [Desulfobacterales bacterium CG23_combo_of_CG06-09_8_20_14_all_51_8]|nr:MAG: FMN reductase [Desulfobacterales bacterium CG23_combo_of_CG06-09_8_20_14_all_51_8]
MKVTAFNGSARKDGNTAIMLEVALAELNKQGIETELYQLAGKQIHGCIACYKCMENKDRRCSVKKDVANECIEKMLASDGILLGSPTYFADITTEMKALVDRAGLVARANGNMFKRKVGAAVVTARRGGCVHAFDSMNHFFLIGEMIIPGSNYWNMGFGLAPGDVKKDTEAMATMKILGENMGWLLHQLNR